MKENQSGLIEVSAECKAHFVCSKRTIYLFLLSGIPLWLVIVSATTYDPAFFDVFLR
jgi:hypothetical protein